MAMPHRKKRFMAVSWFGVVLVFVLAYALLPLSDALAESAANEQAERNVFEKLKAGQRVGPERRYAEPPQPTVYLTFDDGPGKLTPQVLDILREEGIRATFFVLGRSVEEHPELAKRIVNEGHAIGNHSYDHVYKELYRSFDAFWGQVERTDRLIAEATGVRSRLLRAPGGTYTNFDAYYFYYLDQAGYSLFDWNVDSGDARRQGVPAKEIVANATQGPLRHELVVLLHDGPGHEETVKALPDIIRFYKEKGYAFAPLTSDVKPVQFSVGKSKWPRSTDYGEHARRIALARERAAAWPKAADEGRLADDQKAGGETGTPRIPTKAPSVTESTYASPSIAIQTIPEPPLALHLGARTALLEPQLYQLRGDRIYVPLRLLVEQMGGSVDWDDATRQATVRYGVHRIVYDLKRGSVEQFAPGQPHARIPFAAMDLVGDTLMVPLRHTVERLGDQISGYAMHTDKREVRIRLFGGYGLAYAPVLQDRAFRFPGFARMAGVERMASIK